MSDRLTLKELRAARLLAAMSLMAASAQHEAPPRDPYAASGVPNATGKANPKKRAERKRQRKARRKNR